ncbi:MAG TPA: hypothetical protein VGM44_06155, partial [Polyangiaceae bacterium]
MRIFRVCSAVGLGLVFAIACGGSAKISNDGAAPNSTDATCASALMKAGLACDTQGLACPFQDESGCESFAVCDGQHWVFARSTSCAVTSVGPDPPPTHTADASMNSPDSSSEVPDAPPQSDASGDAAPDSAAPDSGIVTEAGSSFDASPSSDADTDAASVCDLAQEGWQY